MASRGKIQGLGDIQCDAQLSTVFESLTKTLGLDFNSVLSPEQHFPSDFSTTGAGEAWWATMVMRDRVRRGGCVGRHSWAMLVK
ncbi:hypothetical protein Vadar_002931 [Vaccinium darrowii]|uniref:Uncharacterized protein n=1 Tax=Vaccinium darrowii TaxID=229202 RepID=A0ACB7YBA5_9ERIC|nr:hypothetical protein Vadar_002931 [Vaccinium darrowii]